MFEPRYQITNKMLKGIASIEAAREIIENSPLVPYWERQFREDAVVRTAHHTTALEGNPLSLSEAREVLTNDEHTVKARGSEIQEVINYRNVIDYIGTLHTTSKHITEEHMNRIHSHVVERIVPDDEVKSYRSAWYGTKNSTTGEISFIAPPPEDVPSLVESFFSWIASEDGIETHPILRAGIIMAEIMRIHPYTEGNGRTARALGTASLYLDKYDIKRFFSLDEYYDQNAPEYYVAIQTYRNVEDSLNTWLEFFVQGLDIELCRVKGRVLEMSKDHRLRQEIGQVSLNDRQEEILKFIEDNGAIKNQDWRDLFPSISDDTVLRDMKDLIDKGVIKKTGKTKAAQYIMR
ncbi:Fic family protein [candidate division WWE3 bacterium]|nr:Fic family protein [candidate division WWE3 bacterium]